MLQHNNILNHQQNSIHCTNKNTNQCCNIIIIIIDPFANRKLNQRAHIARVEIDNVNDGRSGVTVTVYFVVKQLN